MGWLGLDTIRVIAFVINEPGSFPAPLAAIPVACAAIMIAAGIGTTTPFIAPLTNSVTVYIGDISYSTYLRHWPMIVILGSIMNVNAYYYVTVVFATFGLSVASYHFVKNPIR